MSDTVNEVKEVKVVKEVKIIPPHRVKGSAEAKEYMNKLRSARKPKIAKATV